MAPTRRFARSITSRSCGCASGRSRLPSRAPSPR